MPRLRLTVLTPGTKP